MLKKLRRKIISVNFFVVCLILTLIFVVFCCAIGVTKQRDITSNLAKSTYMAKNNLNAFHPNFNMNDPNHFYDRSQGEEVVFGNTSPGGDEEQEMKYTVVVLDQEGNKEQVISRDLSLSQATLNSATTQASKAESLELIKLDSLNLFAYKYDKDGQTYISLTPSNTYHSEMKRLIVYCLILWAFLLLVYFILLLISSNFVIRPVKRSWEKQQQFIADASHELKTPLAVIMANNSLLLSETDGFSDKNIQWLEGIQEESVHMQGLINNLLFLARSDSGNQKIVFENVSLSETLEEDTLQFDPLAYEHGVSINSTIAPDVYAYGDRNLLKMLSHILLENACKYAESGTEIDVNLYKEKNDCVLTVHNFGSPISKEDLPNIFERFYRADKSRTFSENSQGYGLGLAIAKSIAEDHNGSIQVKSSKEKGTIFTVKIKGQSH